MKKVLIGVHKKFERKQHTEIHLLCLNKQYKVKIKWSLDMVSKHVLLYIHLPDYDLIYITLYIYFFDLINITLTIYNSHNLYVIFGDL